MRIWKHLLLIMVSLVSAQVNTEKMRSEHNDGFSGNLSLGYGMAMGNSEYLSFTPSARIDYNTEKYSSFIAASYNRRQSELKKGKEYLLAHKGFAHIRGSRKLSKLFSWEMFGQWEFNEFINLKRRLLGGTGARVQLFDSDTLSSIKLIAGAGGMYEMEYYYKDNDKRLFRSTSYVTFQWDFSKQGSFTTTNYYQVAVTRPNDFRVISESSLTFKLASWLVFGTTATLRYDNDPSAGVNEKYDFELNNTLTVEF